MATIGELKQMFTATANQCKAQTRSPLTHKEYSIGFESFIENAGKKTYENFIIPELTRLFGSLFKNRRDLTVLEIGPGPKLVLEHLPEEHRYKVRKYTAYEPNKLYATELRNNLRIETNPTLPGLASLPIIHEIPFTIPKTIDKNQSDKDAAVHDGYDLILFCHSLYGITDKLATVKYAMRLLTTKLGNGIVCVFHRSRVHQLDSLISQRSAVYSTGIVQVVDDDLSLDAFNTFVAGFSLQENVTNDLVKTKWREISRSLGHRVDGSPAKLQFDSPDFMACFARHAADVPTFAAPITSHPIIQKIKNRKAQTNSPPYVVVPQDIGQLQECVKWAIQHKTKLTVLSGGHGGHCFWPNTVAIDMSAFKKIQLYKFNEDTSQLSPNTLPNGDSMPLLTVGVGNTAGTIIELLKQTNLTVPLGARPSVGAGLWLQGGIGHLSRSNGLTCDSIIGAIIVSVQSGKILRIGEVPDQHCPSDTVIPPNRDEWLWAVKGAGTNFGIVISVTFRTHACPTYHVHQWSIPLNDNSHAQHKLSEFNTKLANGLPPNSSADAYLFAESGRMHLGVTLFQTYLASDATILSVPPAFRATLGGSATSEIMDSIQVFDAEMYMSGMHGGHAGGKTSAFKRCIFLKDLTRVILKILVESVSNRPTPLCYLHFLHGSAAISSVSESATAFGCRDWKFACVITGVWPREEDRSHIALVTEKWVYDIVRQLLTDGNSAYGADLGPDPRDTPLAAKAFGSNLLRLTYLKKTLDPFEILAYTCPLPKARAPNTIVLVTGDSGVGKDYCACFWNAFLREHANPRVKTHVARISDATKQEFAAAHNLSFSRLIEDREYKEDHRVELTQFYQDQIQCDPWLPQKHFLRLVYDNANVHLLFITGMRDDAPLPTFAHLVPQCLLLEIRVRRMNQGDSMSDTDTHKPDAKLINYQPTFVFQNDRDGDKHMLQFAKNNLLPLLSNDFGNLAEMVRILPNFPDIGIDFCHILGISQQPKGIALSVNLMEKYFSGNWNDINAIVSCEVGGLIFASPLAMKVDRPLILLRKAGKLPPPTILSTKPVSHISSLDSKEAEGTKFEMEENNLTKGAKVVVVDDVLASGRTICVMLEMLCKAGIKVEDISVMVIGEFPVHRGRLLLHQNGFGRVCLQSLLTFENP